MKRILKKLAKNWDKVIIGIFLLGLGVFIIANNVFVSMNVDGKSMEPTLSDEQRIWVNYLAYKTGEAEYGDVVVAFNSSENNETKMVKRIVGKPKDTIEIRNNVFYRNDIAVKDIVLPSNKEETTGFGEKITLEAGEYYLLGDNLPESSDSRAMGPIKYDNFVGKVMFE